MRIAPASTAIGICILGFALGSCGEPNDPFVGVPGHPCNQGTCLIGECIQGFCVNDEDDVGEDDVGESSSDSSGDGDSSSEGDSSGDGEGDSSGDGDGDSSGDGDGDSSGDGDGDVPQIVGAAILWTSNTGLIPASLEFSPDDNLLASGGWDGFDGDFMIRSAANGNTVAGPTSTTLDNYAVSWSPSGDRVASIWTGNTDYALFSSAGQNLSTASGCAGGNTTTLAWHPNAEEILVGTDQLDSLCLKNAQTGASIQAWSIEGFTHDDVVWSNSGARFASFVSNIPDGWFQALCIVHVFDRATLAEINEITLEPDYCEYASGLAWRPGTQEIYATGSFEDQGVVASMNATGDITSYFGADAKALAFSPDGTKLGLISDDGYVWIVHPDTWAVQHEFWAHSGLTLSIAWSHDGELLATGGESPRLRVWQLEYGN